MRLWLVSCYKPSRDFTGTDEIDLLVEDVNNYGRTASLSIPIRVAPSVTWNDAPSTQDSE